MNYLSAGQGEWGTDVTLKGKSIQKSWFIYSPPCFKPGCLSFFCGTLKKLFWRILATKQFQLPLISIVYETNYIRNWNGLIMKTFQNIFFLCSAEDRNAVKFGTTQGWVVMTIVIFGWTIPLRQHLFSPHHDWGSCDSWITLGQSVLTLWIREQA